jgi:hypothetical protein
MDSPRRCGFDFRMKLEFSSAAALQRSVSTGQSSLIWCTSAALASFAHTCYDESREPITIPNILLSEILGRRDQGLRVRRGKIAQRGLLRSHANSYAATSKTRKSDNNTCSSARTKVQSRGCRRTPIRTRLLSARVVLVVRRYVLAREGS